MRVSADGTELVRIVRQPTAGLGRLVFPLAFRLGLGCEGVVLFACLCLRAFASQVSNEASAVFVSYPEVGKHMSADRLKLKLRTAEPKRNRRYIYIYSNLRP